MLKLVRSGYKTLLLETPQLDSAIEFLTKQVNVINVYNPAPKQERELNSVLGEASDRDVIIHLTSQIKPTLSFDEVDAILHVREEMFEILMRIINTDTHHLITKTRVGPGIVIMKLIGDEEKVIQMVKDDFHATSATMHSQLSGKSNGTVISFTKGNIAKPVSFEEMHPVSLHTQTDFRDVLQSLRLQNLKYLNAGLHNEDWYELKIKIYDAYGRFELHYKRLAYILEKLDLGLILGESWGTDAATIFLSVGIYKVRFFTFYNPIHIKKVLLGLEFLDDGTRIVDYDLYLKRRKIHWDALRDKEHNSRESLSHLFRQEILSQLTDEEVHELHDMEQEILASRTVVND
jgi:hypothetical protein